MKLNLAGKRFGRLIAVVEHGRATSSGAVLWKCVCDCGNTTITPAANLKAGMTSSCGCYRKETTRANMTTHGGTHKPEYIIWKAMRSRCNYKKNNRYHLYGGRGISVCARWEKFENFLADMGSRPSAKHSIDRKDNDGNYEPGNCVWATLTEQGRNKGGRKSAVPVNGVCWHKETNKYIVQIGVNGRPVYVGVFKLLEEAKEARRQAEINYWGKERVSYENKQVEA